jgi:RimJ/RimL family protein N-acetyltransferase
MAARAPGESGGWVQLSVEERETGRLVGDVGLSPAEGEPGVIKVGYTMSPSSQGRGYATEAVGALADYALDALGADVVRAYASAENLPSIRVAEKVGMHLVERFQGTHEGRTWHGVRYELRREDRSPPPPA